MTNEEKTMLIAYLVYAGEIDSGGDVETQFLDWYQVRGERSPERPTTRRSLTLPR